MKKKLMLITGFGPSLINFRGDLINELIKNDYDVSVMASYFDEPTINLLKKNNIKIYSIKMHNSALGIFQNIVAIISILYILFKKKPDVIMPYTAKAVIFSSIVARVLKIPHIPIITGIGVLHSEGFSNSMIGKFIIFLYKISLKSCRVIFFQNKDDERFFKLNILPKTAKPLIINGSGVNISRFPVLDFPKEITFLMASRLMKEKGIMEYIDAARHLKKKYPFVSFMHAGSNNETLDVKESYIKKHFISAVNDKIIDDLGWLEDIKYAIKKCSAFVLPSYYGEGLPRASLEAMSCGRLIITTDSVGCRETVEDGINGFCIPIKNTDALIKSFEILIKNTEKIEEMGKKSREIVEKKFDVRLVNKQIISSINKINLS